jgi:hypothetical protein
MRTVGRDAESDAVSLFERIPRCDWCLARLLHVAYGYVLKRVMAVIVVELLQKPMGRRTKHREDAQSRRTWPYHR